MKMQEHARNHTGSIPGKVRRGFKKFLAAALSVSIIASGLPTVPTFASLYDEDDDVQEFFIASEDLEDSIKAALMKGDPIKDTAYIFDGAAQEAYEDLFYGADVYELKPEIEDDKDGKLNLKVFARLSGDHELDSYEMTDEDQIIFMLLNKTDKEETARIYIDGYETDLITVVPKGEVPMEMPDEEVPETEPAETEAEIPEETDPVPAAPAVSGGAGGGAADYVEVVIPEEEILPQIEPFDDGTEESYGPDVSAGPGVEAAYEDEAAAADDGSESGEVYDEGSEHGGDVAGDTGDGYQSDDSADAGADTGYDDYGDVGEGSGDVSGDSGYSDDGAGDAGYSDSGDSSYGSADSGDSASGEDAGSDSGSADNGGSDGSTSDDGGSSDSASDNSGSDSSSSDSGSSDNSGSGDSGSSDSGSDSGSSDSGSSDSGSSSGDSGSDSGDSGSSDGEVASVSAHSIGLLAASLGDIVIEIDGDEVSVNMVGEDDEVITVDSEVVLASASDADEEETIADKKDLVMLEGELYEPVIANGNRSAVAFVTTIEALGMEEMSFEDMVFTASDGDINVTVIAPDGALPEDAELSVTRYDEDSEEYADAAEAIDLDAETTGMAALDISFLVDGEEVEPEEEVQVIIDVSDILPEDADASTIKVTHLEERSFLGFFNRVKPVVVANENEGYIDEDMGIVQFSIDNFSVFTVEWNDGTNTSIEVHIYSINGTSVDEELDEDSALIANNGIITIQDLVDHLESNADYTNEYTFRYAMVVYQVAQQPSGYEMTKIGSEGDSVTSISKSGTTYTIYRGTTTSTISDPDSIVIRLYYSVPEVTIATDNAHESEVTFTTSSNYFNGETDDATYTWTLSNDSEGTLTNNNDGTATFTWGSNAQAGDTETVTVTMTIGNETASDTYTLTYGDQQVSITIYANGTTTGQANAHVALVDELGNTVATGTTDENGQVILYAPAGTYTIGVTYVVQSGTIGGGSTSRYTVEGEVVVSDTGDLTGDTTLTLGTAITSGPGGDTNGTNGTAIDGVYYYEHIDVKVAVAETLESTASFSDLDAVYVYDKYGNLIYTSDDLNANPGTTDYNVLFDINGAEDQHSIVVSSEDTIVIVYEIYEDGEFKTYTATYTGGGTYKSDDYYPYNSINAYQLWNQLYGAEVGTTYASQEAFEAAWTSGEITVGVNEIGIEIGGYSYSLIADYLCDTRTTSGQAGLDFVIDVMDAVFEEYDIQIAKTYNTPTTFTEDDLGTFEFTLQEIEKVTASSDDDEGVWDTNEDNLLNTETGSTGSWIGENGVWSSIVELENVLTYEAEDGTNFYYYVLSEADSTTSTAEVQYIGIKITVTYSASTGQTVIVASYCALEATETTGVYNKTGDWEEMEMRRGTDDEGNPYNYYEVPFINTYNSTGFELEKVDDSGNPLSGAIFTISTTSDEGDGTILYFTSETVDNTLIYTLASSTTEGASTQIAVTNGGPVSIQGMATGTYTLSEITAPDGYIAVDDFTVTIADDGTVTVDGTNVSVAEGTDTVTVIDLAVTSITVTKTWVDNDNSYTTRPESITIHLMVDGMEVDSATVTADANGNWTYTFTDLPKYQSDGTTEIVYTITEDAVPGYTTEANGYDVTNTLQTTEVSGEKTWVDEDNANDTRPDSITIYLYADGVQTGDTAVVTSNDNWAWEFTGLPKYQEDGTTEIVYTIMEGETEEGHLGEYIPSYSEDGLSVTNSIPEVSKYVSDPSYGEDVDDELDEDEADNNDTLEYEIKAEHVGNAHDLIFHDLLDNHLDIETLEIQRVILYEDEDDEGIELTAGIDYTYTTDTCGGTDCNMDGCSFEIKILDDDLAGLGSDAYIVIIFDITLKEDIEDFDDNFVEETDNWANISFFSYYATPVEVETYSYGFDIYKYDGDTEEALEGAEFILSKDSDDETVYAQFDVTENTYLLTGWVDSEDDATVIVTDEYGKAVIEGLHDGTFSIEETKAPEGYQQKSGTMTVTITVDEDDPTNPTITATNADVDGLEVQISNTEGETIEIIGFKTWNDGDNADGIRPESITIHLLADGEEVASVTVTAEDDWAWSFSGMSRYRDDGTTEIIYTIIEDIVDGYDSTVDVYNVTNEEIISISGSKTWDDDNDADGIRPDSITIHLFADDEEMETKTVSADDNWTWEFSNLPKYQSGSTTEIVYSITEDNISGYDTTVDGYDVTNEHIPGTVSVDGSKSWDDDNDVDGIRPSSIIVRLFADGEEVASKTVTEKDDWSWGFANLPQYQSDGTTEIVYTISEDIVEGYGSTVNGYDVTNEHIPGTVSVNGSKTWDDSDDADGIRPSSITIRLLADGEEVDSKTVTAKDNWSWGFANLEQYQDDGTTEIVYTITEDAVDGYDTSISGYNVTNTHTPDEEPEPTPTPSSGRNPRSSGGGSGSGSSSGRSGSTAGSDGGPGTSGEGGSDGEDNIWDLLPLPSTGEGRALLFGGTALAISAMALIVLLWYKRKEKNEG